MFSILQPRLEGACFLDLFSGTGANGIEALSRGAAHCDFVDDESRAFEILQQNLAITRLAAQGKMWRARLPAGLGRLASTGHSYDIVYADPPYKFEHYDELLERIVRAGLVHTDSAIIVEHTEIITLESCADVLDLSRQESYGKVRLSFYRLK